MATEGLASTMLALPRTVKRGMILAVDASLCVLTVWLAFFLRIGDFVWLSSDAWPAAAVAMIALPIFAAMGLYRTVLRFVDWDGLATIAQAVAIYGLIYATVFTVFGLESVPRTVGLIQPVLLLIAVASSRAFGRYVLRGGLAKRRRQKNNALVYGAGSAGRQLATALADSPDIRIVGFVDDNRDLHGSVIQGVRVWRSQQLEDLVDHYSVSEVYLAIPSATRRRRNEILRTIRKLAVSVRTLPGLMDLAKGKVTVNDLRPLDVEDLLGRETVEPDVELLSRNITGKVLLITGAGGSIGSELCRQIQKIGPTKLLLVDASEYALYAIHRELERLHPPGEEGAPELIPLLANVCDEQRMRSIMASWRPDTVYHAAAYKHVPLVEHNVVEGIRNNVLGTYTCARLARELGVSDFVLISTDKAVRPTNMMGATKRLAEMALQAISEESRRTRFSMVRFGNVLGSSGSVVPLFRQQIAAGGPVTVTHRDIIRYFMTIPEAAQLVLQAGAMAQGGEVFVLDMGEPVKVVRLAKRMIELSGLTVRDEEHPDGDVEITFTGLRPGEKLYEELLIGNDPTATVHPRIMMASEQFLPLAELEDHLDKLSAAIQRHDVPSLRTMVQQLVPDYAMVTQIVDWVAVERARQDERTDVVATLPFAKAGA